MALSETTDAMAIPRPADAGGDPFDTTDYRTFCDLVDAYVADKGSDLASATTIDLPATLDGHYFDITGTTTITAIESKAAGTTLIFQFDATPQITHHGTSMILPGGVNHTMVAKDHWMFVSLGGGNWVGFPLTKTRIEQLSAASEARGDIIYRGASAWSRLAASTDGYVLATNTSSGDPAWEQVAAAGIASNAVTTAKINSDAVTGAKIADDAIDSEHYTDGSIDTAHLAADAVTGAKIADDALDSEHYTDASIDAAHIASNAVTTAKVNADAITGAKIADDALDSEHYTDGSIDTAHIADNQVTLAKLADSTQGDVLYYGSGGAPAVLSAGTDGHFLKTQGGSANPVWAAAGGGGKIDAVSITSGASGSTTSTSFVDVSGGEVDITTAKGGLIAWYFLSGYNSGLSANTYIALQLDTATEVAQSQVTQNASNQDYVYSGFHVWTSVSDAAHEINIRMKVSAGTFNIRGGAILVMEFDD